MFFLDMVFALVIALLFTAIFTAGFRSRGPWGAWWVFLLVLFLATWAGGIWITPFGPPMFGVYWLPFVFVGLVFALLLTATVPAETRRLRPYTEETAEMVAEETAIAAIGTVFWVLLVGLILVTILWYV